MFVPARLRRSILLFLVMVSTGLGLFLIIFPSPDLSQELELLRRIAEISSRIGHTEQLVAERQHNLKSLYKQFAIVTNALAERADIPKTEMEALLKVANGIGLEGMALAKGQNFTYDLSLPGIHNFLPHTSSHPDSLVPAFKLAKASRSQVSMVLGIPTVKREHQSYLHVTLKSLLENMSEDEAADSLIIVFVAESDLDFVSSVATDIATAFPDQVQTGLIEVVSPPASFYPEWSSLRRTLGDDPDRVQWRSKQNLDYAFLMMYAHWRGHFYVQLEDDVLTKANYITIMRDFALDRTARKEPWFVIDYCQLGFIGKMFKSTDLPTLIQFFLMFYNDKPGDWLLENVIQTMVCKLDQDNKKCKKEKSQLRIQYKPSLFQHIGTHSSLKGKVQKLKDKGFGKVSMYVPHRNPPARIDSAIRHYKSYSMMRAYNGETFYWGLVPQSGDTVVFQLTPPTKLSGFKFISGNAEHPSDRFMDTTVEINVGEDSNRMVSTSLERSEDGFVILGSFDQNGVAEGVIDPEWGPVSHVRLSVHVTSDNWVILSEMQLKEEM
jgi:alpha-1,3-mannosylglycoprotein beta-1,4-N-acetylglucosaminyltransferase A/B